jgi:hypothetical protein
MVAGSFRMAAMKLGKSMIGYRIIGLEALEPRFVRKVHRYLAEH